MYHNLQPQLRRLLLLLLPVSLVATTYLYLYPVFHGCAFPSPDSSALRSFSSTFEQHASTHFEPTSARTPFRLLALGDPQLEGDSSLPDSFGAVPLWSPTRLLFPIQAIRKRLDLFGNDYYLAHIYRTLHWWTKPTHVTVLGDLLGSQWVSDAEFERRGQRFWERVFRGAQRVHDEISEASGRETIGEDRNWRRRIINIVGNHDVGYAGDMTGARISRFERLFGKANWEIWFRISGDETSHSNSSFKNETAELRVVILNSLNLDGPAVDPKLQQETYEFVNNVILTSKPVENRHIATVLLTHLPLHKEAGVCVDAPFVAYHDAAYGGGVKEQNHLTYDSGKGILEGIFGMSGNTAAPGRGQGRPGIILTGHDHEGCDVYHYLPRPPTSRDASELRWKARRWSDAVDLINSTSVPGIREITVRSMMGDFGGNAGLLSVWYEATSGEWRFEYASCSLGVQHIWWAIHIVDLVTLAVLLLFVAVYLGQLLPASPLEVRDGRKHSRSKTASHELIDDTQAVAASGVDISRPHGVEQSGSLKRIRNLAN